MFKRDIIWLAYLFLPAVIKAVLNNTVLNNTVLNNTVLNNTVLNNMVLNNTVLSNTVLSQEAGRVLDRLSGVPYEDLSGRYLDG